MLNLWGSRKRTDCDGATRRDFLKVGVLGATGLALPDLLRARAAAQASGRPTRNTSVVWLWLGGGPTHVETFDPKMSAPAEFRSVVTAPGWEEFPSSPQLFEVVTTVARTGVTGVRDGRWKGIDPWASPPAPVGVPSAARVCAIGPTAIVLETTTIPISESVPCQAVAARAPEKRPAE